MRTSLLLHKRFGCAPKYISARCATRKPGITHRSNPTTQDGPKLYNGNLTPSDFDSRSFRYPPRGAMEAPVRPGSSDFYQTSETPDAPQAPDSARVQYHLLGCTYSTTSVVNQQLEKAAPACMDGTGGAIHDSLSLSHPAATPHRTPFHPLLTNVLHSLPNTMDEATPMKPKNAAEEGQVSMLKSLMVTRMGSSEKKRTSTERMWVASGHSPFVQRKPARQTPSNLSTRPW